MFCIYVRTVCTYAAHCMENNTHKQDNVFEAKRYNAPVTSSSSNGATPVWTIYKYARNVFNSLSKDVISNRSQTDMTVNDS